MADNFYKVVQDAVSDLSEFGYDSELRLEEWVRKLRQAAHDFLIPDWKMEDQLRGSFGAIYARLVEKGGLAKYHPEVARFTIERVKPKLRAELDRRILASSNLIKLNKETAVSDTLRRFQGWATSIPAGGESTPDKNEAKANIKKALQQMPFVQRRCVIDQGMKLTASINNIVATDGGAIAARWRSHDGEAGYDARPDHAKRNNHVFLIRDSWADKAGLVKPGEDGYTDQVEMVGERVYCRCWYVYIYGLGKLPDDMLTQRGRDQLAQARAKIAGMRQ